MKLVNSLNYVYTIFFIFVKCLLAQVLQKVVQKRDYNKIFYSNSSIKGPGNSVLETEVYVVPGWLIELLKTEFKNVCFTDSSSSSKQHIK